MLAERGKFRGMRGATYKAAREFRGYRLAAADQDPIRYGDPEKGENEDDIHMNLYFMESGHRFDFVNRVHEIHKIPDVIERDHNPEIHPPKMSSFLLADSELLPILKDDFGVFTPPGSVDYDQALQPLSTFKSPSTSSSNPSRKKSKSSSNPSTRSGRSLP